MNSGQPLVGPPSFARVAGSLWIWLYPMLGAAAIALATHPFTLSQLGWVATLPLFYAWIRTTGDGRRGAGRRAFASGFWFGFVLLLAIAPWFAGFSPTGYPVGAICWGVLFGGSGVVLRLILRRTSAIWVAPCLASAWILLEWVRSIGTLVFPWAVLSVTQFTNLPVLQLLDLTGAFGLSGLMALFAAAAAQALWGLSATDPHTPERGSDARFWGIRWLTAAAVILVLATIRGVYILSLPPRPGESFDVAIVQASESHRPSGIAVVCISPFGDYLRLTRDAAAGSPDFRGGPDRPDLIVWGECASVPDIAQDRGARSAVATMLAGSEAQALIGSFVTDPEDGQTTNAAVLLSNDGNVLDRYDKVMIVPFGEYLPWRPYLGWTIALGMPEEDLRAGPAFRPVTWSRGKIGVCICFESAFPRVTRALTRNGADVLAILTSDGWTSRELAGLQHYAFAALRAVETRRTVIRAAVTGESAVLDPYGRVLARLPMFEKGVLRSPVRRSDEQSLYVRLGDWPLVLGAAILVAAAVTAVRSQRPATD